MIRIFTTSLCLFVLSCSPNKIFLEKGILQLDLNNYLNLLEESEDYYIIDVRTPIEYNKGHLNGAINISYIGFNFRKKIRTLDRAKTVFIYCQTAHRSPYAARKLRKEGFLEVIDLKDGYRAYKKFINEKNLSK